jgi:rhamnosyltransferase
LQVARGVISVLGRVGLVIPTLNAGARWGLCLAALAQQSIQPHRRLIIDSSSSDQTADKARSSGIEVIQIPRKDFNHGGTRQWAVEYLSDCDVVIFLTQDAILASTDSLKHLIARFDDPAVAVAYGRQLPHQWAAPIEAHARIFNYGDESLRKDLAAVPMMGPKVYFCSNSFAAYRRSILMALGGFRRDLILGEDAEYAARAIKAGYANVYCAKAVAYHSHNYKVGEVFWRYFDTGVFHAHCPWMREEFGSYRGEGVRFVKSELRYLAAHAPLQIPRALLHTAAKYVGYKLGRQEKIIPNAVKAWLSMTPGYWQPRRP